MAKKKAAKKEAKVEEKDRTQPRDNVELHLDRDPNDPRNRDRGRFTR